MSTQVRVPLALHKQRTVSRWRHWPVGPGYRCGVRLKAGWGGTEEEERAGKSAEKRSDAACGIRRWAA
jgi:hypothetical protein